MKTQGSAAAAKPQIKTYLDGLNFFKKQHCHIWVRFKLSAVYNIVNGGFLRGLQAADARLPSLGLKLKFLFKELFARLF